MKTLREMELTFKVVKDVCKSFNDSGLSAQKIKMIGITGEAMIVDLINKIDDLPDTDMGNIPELVKSFYAALPDECFNVNVGVDELKAGTPEEQPEEEITEPPKKTKGTPKVKAKEVQPEPEPEVQPEPVKVHGTRKTKPAAEEVPATTVTRKPPTRVTKVPVNKSSCPGYGKDWSATEKECLTCAADFPDENINCKRVVRGIPETVKTEKKVIGLMKSRYGHRSNTMAACIDDLAWKGSTIQHIVTTVMEWYGRSEPAAKGKVKSHLNHLVRDMSIMLDYSEDGSSVKAVVEYSAGQHAKNTAKAVPGVKQTK